MVHDRRERSDKAGFDADRRDTVIRRHSRDLGETAVIEIELDECFRMLGHERNRRHDYSDTVVAGLPDLFVVGWTDPFERPDPALVANAPVEFRPSERRNDRRRGLFYLIRIRVAAAHDLLRPAMC